MHLKQSLCALLVATTTLTCSAEPLTVRLTNGAQLTGDFVRQTGGLFYKTENGGRQIQWRHLEPGSLPESLRSSLRTRLISDLYRADQLYRSGSVTDAAPIYAKVLLHRTYLDLQTQTSPIFKDIQNKAHARVLHDTEWIPFTQRQAQLGLVLDRGAWLPREEAKINAKFDAIQKLARMRQDHQRTINDMIALLRQYPQSNRAAEAEALVSRLTIWLAKKEHRAEAAAKARAQAQANAIAAAQQAPRQVRVIEQQVVNPIPVGFWPYNSGYSSYYGGGFHHGGYTGASNRYNNYIGGRHRNASQRGNTVTLQPGYSFKQSHNRFNTGYPFSPPVSVRLTGQTTRTSGHRGYHGHRGSHHRQPGLSIHGQVGNAGVHVYRKDPIKVRF